MKNELNNVVLNKEELNLITGGKLSTAGKLFVSSAACGAFGPVGFLVGPICFILGVVYYCKDYKK